MFDFEEANEAIKKNEVMNIQAGGPMQNRE